MASPSYRMTVFKPRSEDPAETVVMTPAACAPHSDNFKVATRTGITGFQPYMQLPSGRRGIINVITGRGDVGQLEVDLGDIKVSGNLSRWVTAFAGNAEGLDRLKGCKVLIEELLDTGGSWTDFFTGRIFTWGVTDDRVMVRLEIRGIEADLRFRLFQLPPHASVASYAALPYILPVGVPVAYADVAATARLAGNFDLSEKRITLTDAAIERVDNIVLAWLDDQSEQLNYQSYTVFEVESDNVRVEYSLVGGGSKGDFRMNWLRWKSKHDLRRMHSITVELLDSSIPEYRALPAGDEACEVALRYHGPIGDDTPLFIQNVHPADLILDIADGFFGPRKTDGTPLVTIPYGTMTAFTGDPSWGLLRFQVREEAEGFEWIEDNISGPAGLGFRINYAGELELIDLRLRSSVSVQTTITNADIAAGNPPTRTATGEDSAAWVVATHYSEAKVALKGLGLGQRLDDDTPDLPVGGWLEQEHKLETIDETAIADLGEQEPVNFTGLGFRARVNEIVEGNAGSRAIQNRLLGRMGQLNQAFGKGRDSLELTVRRSAAIEAVIPGHFVVVDVDEIPDPTSFLRGGPRLMQVEERTEEHLLVRLAGVDLGINVAAGVPVLGTPTLGTDTLHEVNQSVTLNSDSDLVEIHYAAKSGGEPAETDAAWIFGTIASGATTIRHLQVNTKIHVRGRSIPSSLRNLRRPSAWVYAGAVTTAAYLTPTSPQASNIGGREFLFSWVNVETAAAPQILLALTGVGRVLLDQIEPGSTEYWVRYTDIDKTTELALSTGYDVGVRYVGPEGSFSAEATVLNVVTTGSASAAPSMLVTSILISG